jgi:hypothetical protein
MDTLPDRETLKEIPRQYQLELYQRAKESNIIAVLDTGTGKTLIALLILKHMAAISDKFSVFLVPTVPLVSQQAAYLSLNSSLRICHTWGGLTDTCWTSSISDYDVFVMTPMMLLKALDHGSCRLSQMHLLVFDECHRCRLGHPYNLIMSHHYFPCEPTIRPKIFGMTASPFGSKDQSIQVIEQLERNLDCIAISPSVVSSLQRYVSRPTERIVFYEEGNFFEPPSVYVRMMQQFPQLYPFIEREATDCLYLADLLGPWAADRAFEMSIEELAVNVKRKIRELEMQEAENDFNKLHATNELLEGLSVQETNTALDQSDIMPDLSISIEENAAVLEKTSLDPLNRSANGGLEEGEVMDLDEEMEPELEDGEVQLMKRKGSQLEDEGFVVKVPKMTVGLLEGVTKDDLMSLLDGCNSLQNDRYWGIRSPSPKPDQIGEKVHCLIKILLEFEKENDFFCGIVFCQNRLMAHLLKLLIQKVPSLSYIKCDYLLGHGTKSAKLYRKACLTSSEQKDILSRFRSGELNLLIATNVAEEGLDIKPCNCVIRFDMLDANLTSYIQSRGRARHRTSQFIIIAKKGDESAEEILKCNLELIRFTNH